MTCCDTLSEEINGLRIEISKLVNREFDLECEVERLSNSVKVLKSILSRYLSTEAIQFHYEKELKELIE